MRLRYILALILTMMPTLTWLFFNIFVILRGPLRICPRCSGMRSHRSSRRLADRVLPAFIAARRCEVCGVRFYHLKSVNYNCRPASPRVPRRVRRPELVHSA